MSMPQLRYKGWPYPVTDFGDEPTLTVQSSGVEVDINRIVARINKGLSVPVVNGQPFYGDVSEFDGLQDAIMKVQEADELFMSYPADLREKFDNDPVQFVEFMSDPKNLDEAVKLGLAQKALVAPPPEVVPPVSPEPGAAI